MEGVRAMAGCVCDGSMLEALETVYAEIALLLLLSVVVVA